jgi:hypothetical protein
VRKRRRKLSFSVIFGRSDLISFSSDDRNAAGAVQVTIRTEKAWGHTRKA